MPVTVDRSPKTETDMFLSRGIRLMATVMGLLEYIGVTVTKSQDYWPLNFNA